MTAICFAGTYSPIICGIGDYTRFLTDVCPAGKWGVLSFDLNECAFPLQKGHSRERKGVWYGLPWGSGWSSTVFDQGLSQLDLKFPPVIWFQHEMGIWPDTEGFIRAIRSLTIPKIITFHTLHFQSGETSCGLRKNQYHLLKSILPHVDAITVFSHGVYYAVTSAFPEFRDKVYIIKHGIHNFPEIACLSRREARGKLLDFLIYESNLKRDSKDLLLRGGIFSGRNTVILGETGFLSPAKQSETLYLLRDNLQQIMPQKRVIAVRIGSVRENAQRAYADCLQRQQNGIDKFLLEVWLPEEVIPLAQRAFDVNLYWPVECTQSGVVAHALGAGAIIAARALEGSGEMLKSAGQPVDKDLESLTLKIRDILLNPYYTDRIEEMAFSYAERFSWKAQAFRHYDLAYRVSAKSTALAGRKPVGSSGRPEVLSGFR